MLRMLFATIAIGLGMTSLLHGQAPQAPGHWPQWRGPNRDGISPETGLLKEWPEGGPPLFWKAEGLGEGVSSVAVAGGRVFTLGYQERNEVASALDENNGKQLWSVAIGPAVAEHTGMRWLNQRTPTVDGERAYFFTARGELICLESATGKELWRKDYARDFGGQRGLYGYCDFPLVDGDKLICTPGGSAALVALNKLTGDVVWKASAGDKAAYAGTIVSTINGARQYISFLDRSVISVAAADGKRLWEINRIEGDSINRGAPVVRDNFLFHANSNSNGDGTCRMFKLPLRKGDIGIEEMWSLPKPPAGWLLNPVLVEDYVYLSLSNGALICIELKTGKVAAEKHLNLGSRQCSLSYADGQLYLRSMTGKAALVEANPTGFQLHGVFDPPRPPTRDPAGVSPVVTGGRLYLRDMNLLLCYDIKAKPRSRGPRPPFVPTPQDVVEKMLELVDVKRTDTVVDLGCGDGRIVVTAAQKFGCKSIGYDLDKECLRLARENVKQNDLKERMQIIEEDIFNVDLSKVDVVTLNLFPSTNVKLIPQFEKMKPGSRIVSHAADMKGVVPNKVITVKSKDDDQERKLYLWWTVPLKKEEPSK